MTAPFLVYPVFVMQALCFAIFASAFNLLFGYTGLCPSVTPRSSASPPTSLAIPQGVGLTPEVGIVLGGLTGAALGALIGGLAIRRQGIYFAMITFALAEVVYFVCVQAPFTGGEDGLQSVQRGRLFGLVDLNHPLAMYYFVLVEFVLCLLVIRRIVDSPFGQVLKGIRENESRAISLGYRTNRYKLVAFVLSAGLSGIAGGTKTIVMQFASLSDVHWHRSGEVVLMTLLGGVGTISGPPVGALFVVTLNEQLAELGEWVTFILGAIFVACVLAFRRGFVGTLAGLRVIAGVPAAADEATGAVEPEGATRRRRREGPLEADLGEPLASRRHLAGPERLGEVLDVARSSDGDHRVHRVIDGEAEDVAGPVVMKALHPVGDQAAQGRLQREAGPRRARVEGVRARRLPSRSKVILETKATSTAALFPHRWFPSMSRSKNTGQCGVPRRHR